MNQEKISCPYCLNEEMLFKGYKELKEHVQGHVNISSDKRKAFLEGVTKKNFYRSYSPAKKKGKERSNVKKSRGSRSRKKRDISLAKHRKSVVEALQEIGVDQFHILNIQKAGDKKAIDRYVKDKLADHRKAIDRIKKRKKKVKPLPLRLIYTPMGNKR